MSKRKAKCKEGLKGGKRRKSTKRQKEEGNRRRQENDDECLPHYVLLKG